ALAAALLALAQRGLLGLALARLDLGALPGGVARLDAALDGAGRVQLDLLAVEAGRDGPVGGDGAPAGVDATEDAAGVGHAALAVGLCERHAGGGEAGRRGQQPG